MVRRYRSTISYRLREIPIKRIKVWKDAQARTLDREGVAELAKSIKSEGLQNPPMVQKEGKNTYLLMSGQRRLAALKRLKAKRIPVLVLTKNTKYDLENAKAASVIENIHRKNMNVKELANACRFLAEEMGKSAAARSLGMSPQTFKKYHGFAGVPDKLKNMVPKVISRDEAMKLYIAVPNVSKAVKIAERISKLDSPIKKNYLRALAMSPRSSHKILLKRARNLRIQRNIAFKLSKRQAKGLIIQSRRKELTPQELANDIVTGWLKKKGY